MAMELVEKPSGQWASDLSSIPEALIEESNHRIGNSLQLVAGLVQMQAKSLPDALMDPTDVRRLLREIGGRIDAVGRLHRLLSSREHSGAVNLGPYLKEIAESAVYSLAADEAVTLDYDCEIPILSTPVQALSLGLIVNEIVTNAIKYAHPAGNDSAIRLTCTQTGDGLTVIEVADDGVGLPDGFNCETDGGTGFHLVHTLATQLGATFTFDTSALGLTFQMSVG